jgi:serine/threonine-protein kinase
VLEKIGKYEIRIQIGRGAMGTVFEGFDTIIGRRVAIKTLRVELFDAAQLPGLLVRFKREAQSAGGLSHPHIVTIFDYGEEGGTPYIVMEYISGTELGHYLDRGARFSLEDVVRIMTQLLGALGHAHEHGVVHRDLKPANMFLLPDGSLKVVDFGIARVEASDLTDTGAMLGTPAYMSPEQCLGTQVDHRSDLFSAGVILYQLLTGDKPFTGSVTTIIQKVLRQDPLPPSELNPTISTAWDKVIARAMAKKPEARYESARQFAEAIKTAYQAGRVHEEETRRKAAEAEEHARRGAEERSRAEAQRRTDDERREAQRIARTEMEARQAAEERAKAALHNSDTVALSSSATKKSPIVVATIVGGMIAIAGTAAYLYGRKPEPVASVPVAQAPVPPKAAIAAPAPSKEEIAKIEQETEQRIKKDAEERIRSEYAEKAAAAQTAAKAAADKEKVAARKIALAKATADEAAAEKVIADKAAAEKAEAVRAAAEKVAAEKAKQNGRSAVETHRAGNTYSGKRMYVEALQQYRIAAEQNYAPAQNDIGWLFMYGRGVTRDYCAGSGCLDTGLHDQAACLRA